MVISTVVIAAAAYVGGCCSPAVGRKLKAWFKSEETAAVAEVEKVVPKL